MRGTLVSERRFGEGDEGCEQREVRAADTERALELGRARSERDGRGVDA